MEAMEVDEFEGIGGLRALSLVISLVLLAAEIPLSSWACSRYLPGFYGESEGGGGVFLTFVVLPLAAGGLTCFALWRVAKAAAIVSGLMMGAGTFLVAAMGC